MKITELRKLIREEVRSILREDNISSLGGKIDPNKKYYWFEYYPHDTGATYKSEAAVTGETLLSLKKLYDSGKDDIFGRVLKAAAKNQTFYFIHDVFSDSWDELSKALGANKAYGDLTDEGSFAISPNSMAEAKKMVRKIESEQESDRLY